MLGSRLRNAVLVDLGVRNRPPGTPPSADPVVVFARTMPLELSRRGGMVVNGGVRAGTVARCGSLPFEPVAAPTMAEPREETSLIGRPHSDGDAGSEAESPLSRKRRRWLAGTRWSSWDRERDGGAFLDGGRQA